MSRCGLGYKELPVLEGTDLKPTLANPWDKGMMTEHSCTEYRVRRRTS